jgi:hypothetical protein
MKTTQITVRNVDPILKQRIDKLAKLRAMSINDLVLETLRAEVSLTPSKKNISWDKYCGIVAEGDIDESFMDDFEKIDPEMWK